MKVQKRKLMRILLVPLLLVVLFQGIMPFFMLMASGVKIPWKVMRWILTVIW